MENKKKLETMEILLEREKNILLGVTRPFIWSYNSIIETYSKDRGLKSFFELCKYLFLDENIKALVEETARLGYYISSVEDELKITENVFQNLSDTFKKIWNSNKTNNEIEILLPEEFPDVLISSATVALYMTYRVGINLVRREYLKEELKKGDFSSFVESYKPSIETFIEESWERERERDITEIEKLGFLVFFSIDSEDKLLLQYLKENRKEALLRIPEKGLNKILFEKLKTMSDKIKSRQRSRKLEDLYFPNLLYLIIDREALKEYFRQIYKTNYEEVLSYFV